MGPRAGLLGHSGPLAMPSQRQNCLVWARRPAPHQQALSRPGSWASQQATLPVFHPVGHQFHPVALPLGPVFHHFTDYVGES